MPARILNCTDAEYYAGGSTPALSQSIAHTLLTKSPAHAYDIHPLLGNRPRAPTKAMDEGQLVHTLLLGKGARIEIVNADNFRTKAAQETRDNAIAQGMLPVIRRVYEEAEVAVMMIRANIAAFGIHLERDMAEVAIEWTEVTEDGNPVLCRCKMDHVDIAGAAIVDVKKAENAHPARLGRLMFDYGMDIQRAAYVRALEQLRPEHQGRADMVFLFCELEPPYAVVPAMMSGAMRAIGDARWLRAIKLWDQCLRSKTWPAYARDVVSVEPPPWALNEELAA